MHDLFTSLKFADNKTDTASRLEIYANAHLLRTEKHKQTPLLKRIALACNTGVTSNDLLLYEKLAERLIKICEVSFERNVKLYVDAEQTYIQGAIESIG